MRRAKRRIELFRMRTHGAISMLTKVYIRLLKSGSGYTHPPSCPSVGHVRGAHSWR